MYNYGGNYGNGCGCNNYATPVYAAYPTYGNNNYAIILVLFILLVIVIGSRYNH